MFIKPHRGIGFEHELFVTPIVRGDDRSKWRVYRDFTYNFRIAGEKQTVTIAHGFITDGASVPPGVRWIMPRVSARYFREAVIHDWLLVHERHRFSRRDIDKIFAGALKLSGNKPITVTLLYFGVSIFGRLLEGKKYKRAQGEL